MLTHSLELVDSVQCTVVSFIDLKRNHNYLQHYSVRVASKRLNLICSKHN